jgi:hypothetical protein
LAERDFSEQTQPLNLAKGIVLAILAFTAISCKKDYACEWIYDDGTLDILELKLLKGLMQKNSLKTGMKCFKNFTMADVCSSDFEAPKNSSLTSSRNLK